MYRRDNRIRQFLLLKSAPDATQLHSMKVTGKDRIRLLTSQNRKEFYLLPL